VDAERFYREALPITEGWNAARSLSDRVGNLTMLDARSCTRSGLTRRWNCFSALAIQERSLEKCILVLRQS
jgi:hypothetical protein